MLGIKNVRVRVGVLVGALHPTIGRIYWEFSDESSVNGADYYGLTTCPSKAVLLEEEWRTNSGWLRHGQHIPRVGRELLEDDRGWPTKSGQTLADFLDWINSAEWEDLRAPARAEQLVDHGYFYEWQEFFPCPPTSTAPGSQALAFELALSSRLHWMMKRCLDAIGLWERADEEQAMAFSDVWQLASIEACQQGRYGDAPPILLSDTPELVREYLDVYRYWNDRLCPAREQHRSDHAILM